LFDIRGLSLLGGILNVVMAFRGVTLSLSVWFRALGTLISRRYWWHLIHLIIPSLPSGDKHRAFRSPLTKIFSASPTIADGTIDLMADLIVAGDLGTRRTQWLLSTMRTAQDCCAW
jgi:hypothetical protein